MTLQNSVQSSASPFSRVTVGLMLVVGFAAFIGLLYGLGAGDRLRQTSDGGGHGASNSAIGFQAIANLLEKTGTTIQISRSPAGFSDAGLLILTPRTNTKSKDLKRAVEDRRHIGPTMIILPKWHASPLNSERPGGKPGWVAKGAMINSDVGTRILSEVEEIRILNNGLKSDLVLEESTKAESTDADQKREEKIAEAAMVKSEEAALAKRAGDKKIVNSVFGGSLELKNEMSLARGDYILPIVSDPVSGNMLIAYVDDGGDYRALGGPASTSDRDEGEEYKQYPVVIVADADLLNNMGLENKALARNAILLVQTLLKDKDKNVIFDLTFNGLGSSQNLLTLAFAPPFLSATICLIFAAILAAWMAFNRFGPPLREQRVFEFGRTALVTNSAGFVRRMQREHLAAPQYDFLIRAQIVAALGLKLADDETLDEKLDALGPAGSNAQGQLFSILSANLVSAQKRYEIRQCAAALYEWKKEKVG